MLLRGMRLRPEATGVTESPLVQIATKAEGMPGAIKLCYGESDMPSPDFIRQAADDAIRAGHTFYTHTAGYAALREAIAEKVHALHGVSYRPSEVMATVGASMAIFTAIRALVGAGDNAIIVSPAYAIFHNAIVLAGGEPRHVPLTADGTRFRLDLERVRRAADGRTRMIVVNSPSNPTGWIISPDEQRAIYDIALQHDLVILADEVYERLAFEDPIAPSFARVVEDKERLIVANSFSKTYNMTGWRLGWAQGSERVIQAMYKAAEFITSNPSAMVQQAGITALRDGEPWVEGLRRHYSARRAQVVEGLKGLPGVLLPEPQGAFYAFPRIEGAADSTAFTTRLLEATGLALAPGAAFGSAGEGHVRVCFASSERTITDALARLCAFMSGAANPVSRTDR